MARFLSWAFCVAVLRTTLSQDSAPGEFMHPLLGRTSAVSYGAKHTLFLTPDGKLWGEGDNQFGQLGDGTTTSKTKPVNVWLRVVEMSAGSQHSVLVDNVRAAWSFGRNDLGQLGDGTRLARRLPRFVLGDVVGVSAGYKHSVFVKADGTVWATGMNDDGQLGDGSNAQRVRPVQVKQVQGVSSVAAGYFHSVFLKADSCVFAAGQNIHGQLGDGSRVGTNVAVPTNVCGIERIRARSTYTLYTRSLENDGTTWVAGLYEEAELAEVPYLSKPALVITEAGDIIPESPYYPLPDRAGIGGPTAEDA